MSDLFPGSVFSKYFHTTDSKENFEKNLKKQPDTWHYRNKEVYYRYNARNYRTDEWNDIDWSESVVIFGGSTVLGTGVSEDETISGQLCQLLGRPVINLGVGGSGPLFNLQNSVLLMENFSTPWAVVQHWPPLDRIHVFDNDQNKIRHLGSWDPLVHPLFMAWNDSKNNSQYQVLFSDKISKYLWKDKTRYHRLTYDSHICNTTKCPYITRVDFARDMIHPGYKTSALSAKNIADNLK
jgi:hypothetical protein